MAHPGVGQHTCPWLTSQPCLGMSSASSSSSSSFFVWQVTLSAWLASVQRNRQSTGSRACRSDTRDFLSAGIRLGQTTKPDAFPVLSQFNEFGSSHACLANGTQKISLWSPTLLLFLLPCNCRRLVLEPVGGPTCLRLLAGSSRIHRMRAVLCLRPLLGARPPVAK